MDVSSNEWLDQPLWFSLGWQDMLQQKPSENLKKKLFICGCAGSSLLRGLSSSCGKQGLVVMQGLLMVMPSLIVKHKLQAHGLQQLWHMGSPLWFPGSRAQAP